MQQAIQTFFECYAAAFNRAVAGEPDLDSIADFYAPAFIAASAQGVMPGQNDAGLKTLMQQGFAHYRATGARSMELGVVDVHAIDELHAVAHVSWVGHYRRRSGEPVRVPFQVHYLMQLLPGQPPRVFGWVAGDEQAELTKHGLP